jgi:putative transposase
LPGQVLLNIVHLLMCRVLGVAVLVFRRDRAKAAGLLVLRHENAVLRRHVSRVRYDPADRVWFVALARLLPRRRWTQIFPVPPAMLLAWHRRLAAAKYDTSKQRKPGRPPTARSIAGLVVRLAKENPRWDTADPRRADEARPRRTAVGDPACRGHRSGAAPVRPGLAPVLARPATGIVAVDFLHVDTMLLGRLYVLIFIEHGTPPDAPRRGHRPSTVDWTVQQARNLALTLDEQFGAIKLLIHDRGSNFTASFDAVFEATGARIQAA